MLQAALAEPLKQHLIKVKALHDEDLAAGFGEVYMPMGLDIKYPNAGRAWAWQYVFPSIKRSIDPLTNKIRRHHADEKTVQRAVKRAAKDGNIIKLATPHTLTSQFCYSSA